MSERPTQTPASSAQTPQASVGVQRDGLRIDERRGRAAPRQNTIPNESLAARAERFRNGAPFLVERATLYDPDPLDLPVAPAERRMRGPRSLLPAALTLLGVVIVVGLAAGILFVRNTDGPRSNDVAGRLEQFSERTGPRAPSDRPTSQSQTRRDQVPYDLTRRSHDQIVGAWRTPKGAEKAGERPPVGNDKLAAPAVAPPPEAAPESTPEPARTGLRRLMPRRFSGWPSKRTAEQVAEPATPPRAPLDEPHVPKKYVDGEPAVPASAPAKRDTAAVPQTPPGANVVARVGRATDPPPRARPETGAPARARDGAAARRAQRAQLRRMRDARRREIDLDRFLVRDKGDVPHGFVFSGPQAQRP